jgi:magnesium transporter
MLRPSLCWSGRPSTKGIYWRSQAARPRRRWRAGREYGFREESTGSVSTMVAVYEDGKKAGGKRSLSDASAASRDPRAVVWISLVEPSREELDSVARQFELQELAQEDTETRKGVILKFQGRGLTFMVSPARYVDDSGTVEIGELDVLLEEGLAITVLRGEGPTFHDVEQGLEEGSYLSRLRSGAILRALLHRVLDDYVSVVDGLGDDLAGLEADVLEGDGRVTNRLYELSREVARFQRVTQHLEAVLEGLAHRGSQEPGSNSELGMRLGVARSRARWINSRVSEFVGLLQNLFNANLTLVSVKQSDQTRRISAWAAIVAVPTVIASIYGMNFRYMPELGFRYGYPIVLLAMVASCIVLYVVFKRIGWL